MRLRAESRAGLFSFRTIEGCDVDRRIRDGLDGAGDGAGYRRCGTAGGRLVVIA